MADSATALLPLQGNLMRGRRGMIMGVANDKSLAWGIAKHLSAQGAELAFTFQGEALEKRVRPLAGSLGSKLILPCDVTDAASMDGVFDTLQKEWGGLDFLVHAIGYADKWLDSKTDTYVNTAKAALGAFTALIDDVRAGRQIKG